MTSAYFDLLGVRAVRGRVLTAADDDWSREPALALVSHRLWQQELAGTAFVVAALAGIPSARRAAAVEPIVAMRSE